jgi:hypothetical protein
MAFGLSTVVLLGRSTAEATDINGTITVDGAAVQVPITSSGQKAYYTFNGTAGQLLGVGITAVSGLTGTVSVLKPDGSTLTSGSSSILSSGNDIDPAALPTSGTYTLKVNPGVTTGSLTLTLSSDIAGTIAADGSSVTSTITRRRPECPLHVRGHDGTASGYWPHAGWVEWVPEHHQA